MRNASTPARAGYEREVRQVVQELFSELKSVVAIFAEKRARVTHFWILMEPMSLAIVEALLIRQWEVLYDYEDLVRYELHYLAALSCYDEVIPPFAAKCLYQRPSQRSTSGKS